MSDPNAWIGLATLVGLEIVLGVDNLVFTAILAERLPPGQRDRARFIGLALALIMRLALLGALSALSKLTAPLVSLAGLDFSGRDLILIAGGVFLIAKGTLELQERLDVGGGHAGGKRRTPAFWQVIVQIILLDLVFSLDSIITAVGMVNELSVMIIAVIVAVGVMILASGPLMRFVSGRPSVVILCLGFLLMIGFSLLVDGFGLHIPKGYLYAAIGFSVLVEAANEARRRNRAKVVERYDLRERASHAILRMLGGAQTHALSAVEEGGVENADAFRDDEKLMMHGVLELGERRLRSIMTPRQDIEWLDATLTGEALREKVAALRHSWALLARREVDDFLGFARTRDLAAAVAAGGDVAALARPPLVLPDTSPVLPAMDRLRRAPSRAALVVDEHGAVQGVVTPFDLLEAIAGEFPDDGEVAPPQSAGPDGPWTAPGAYDIRRLGAIVGRDLADPQDRYATLAGFVSAKLGRLPTSGDVFEAQGLRFTVASLDGRNAGMVRIAPVEAPAP